MRPKRSWLRARPRAKTDFFHTTPFTPIDREIPTPILNEAREMIAGVREASPDFDICVEMHAKFNAHSAGRIMKMCEPYDVYWVEEPLPPEDVEAMAFLQNSINVPIALGESLQSSYNFREVLEKGACRNSSAGPGPGLEELQRRKKIAAMAGRHITSRSHPAQPERTALQCGVFALCHIDR